MADREQTLTISVPEAVWLDALDPMVSGMHAELELPDPRTVKRGRGASVVYDGVTVKQARDVAEYIGDRGEMLLGQGVDDPYDPFEKAQRARYRAAVKAAEKIRAQIASVA